MLNVDTGRDVLQKKWGSNQDALDFLNLATKTNKCIFLTGKAGTGKSTLIKDLIELARKNGQEPIILGSTGISALNIEGQTVHSFFALGIENTFFEDIQHHIKDKISGKYKLGKYKVNKLMDTPFVIIDEISMLSSNIVDNINQMMKHYSAAKKGHNEVTKQAFGGIQVIFVGDPFQLPPVRDEDWTKKLGDKYSSEWFFDSTIFKKLDYIGIELKKSYRQQNDMVFADLLDKIRDENFGEKELDLLNQQSTETISKDSIFLATHKSTVSTINSQRLRELNTKEHIFYAQSGGFFPDRMKRTDDTLKLKVGAKIMTLTNDTQKRWVNGSLATIIGFDEDEDGDLAIQAEIGNSIVYIKKHRWDNEEVTIRNGVIENKILGFFVQMPVQLAYASTIHKSQGLSFDNCQVHIENTFTGGQSYTALSRTRTLRGLKIVGKITKNNLFFDPKASNFVRNDFQKKLFDGDLSKLVEEAKKLEEKHAFIEKTKSNKVNEYLKLDDDTTINKERLIKLYKHKVPIFVLAKIFKTDKKHIEQILVDLGVKKQKNGIETKINEDSLIRLFEKGSTLHEMSITLNTNESEIKTALRLLGKKKKLNLEKVEKFLENDSSKTIKSNEDLFDKINSTMYYRMGGISHMAEQKELYGNAYKKWTKEEEEKLKKLFTAGLETETISIILDRNEGGIRSRLRKMGLID